MALIINCTRNFRQVVFGSMHLPKNLPNKGKKMFVDLGSNSNLNKPVIFYLSTCLEYNTILEKKTVILLKTAFLYILKY